MVEEADGQEAEDQRPRRAPEPDVLVQRVQRRPRPGSGGGRAVVIARRSSLRQRPRVNLQGLGPRAATNFYLQRGPAVAQSMLETPLAEVSMSRSPCRPCLRRGRRGVLPRRQRPLRADWPQWRGPNRDGVSTETGLLQTGRPAVPPWPGRPRGLGTGFSSVAVAGGRIFTMGDVDGAQMLIALDAADGKRLWTAKVGAPWVDEMGGPRGTPTVDGDLVYALGTEGDLVAVEAATGKERWRKSLPARLRRPDDVDVEVERVAAGGRRPRRRHARGARGGPGRPRQAHGQGDLAHRRAASSARRARTAPRYSSIVISNGGGREAVRAAHWAAGLVGVRASDGKFLWGYNRVANDVANIPTPIVKGDLVFASTGYQTGAALLKLAPGRRAASTAPRGVLPRRAHLPEPPRRDGARRRPRLRRPRPQPRASPSPSSWRRARWSGAATSGTRARARRRSPYADGQPLLPLPERRR